MRTHSTADVAKRCAAACGKSVGEQFVRQSYMAMHGLEPMGIGHKWHLTDAESQLVIKYAMEWHGSPLAPGITAWAKKHDYAIPGLKKSLLPVVTRPSAKSPSESVTKIVTAKEQVERDRRIKELEARVARLEKPGTSRLQLVDQTGNRPDARREKINARVRHFAMTHPVKIDEVWNWLRKRWTYIRDVTVDTPNLMDGLERGDNLSIFLLDLDTMLALLEEEMVGQQRLGL